MEKYDLIIVGAGPAGIFTAVELLRHGSKKKMLLVEKGKPVEKRHCPKAEVGHCVNCRPTCAITTGFSGAGAFSDGKLSLSYEVGGDLPTLIGEEFAQELIDYTDKIYLEFGADPHVEGIYTGEDIKEIRKNAIHAGLKLVDCPIRHLGTEKAQELYLAIQNYLADNGVEMRFNTECENIILEEEGCKGVLLKDGDSLLPVYADEVVIGTGRRGADWLEKLCAEHHIAHKPGTVDIGVRVECRNEVMEKVNRCCMSPNSSATRSLGRTRCAPSARTPAALWRRKTTTTTLRWSTATASRKRRARTPTLPFWCPTTLPSPSTSPSPTPRRWAS